MRVVGPLAAALLAVAVLVGCGSQEIKSSQEQKAQQLQAKLQPLGMDVPTGVLVSLYQDDGGYLCAAAAGPGDFEHVALAGHRFALRKLHVDPNDIAYVRAVIGVYCPDQTKRVDHYLSGLEQGNDGA
jgi:hypothetical protein